MSRVSLAVIPSWHIVLAYVRVCACASGWCGIVFGHAPTGTHVCVRKYVCLHVCERSCVYCYGCVFAGLFVSARTFEYVHGLAGVHVCA